MSEVARIGKVVSINVSRGGVPKLPIERAYIGLEGVDGDRQRDRRFHGGPMRAVCLFSYDRILAMREEGHPIDIGTTGENLTIQGLEWDEVTPGTRLRIGDVELEATSYAVPCRNIAGSFAGERIARMSQKVNPGWSRVYTRVVTEGEIAIGQEVTLLP